MKNIKTWLRHEFIFLLGGGGCGEAAAYKERTHYTPITVWWEIRQALMGDHVPMENPPFELSE